MGCIKLVSALPLAIANIRGMDPVDREWRTLARACATDRHNPRQIYDPMNASTSRSRGGRVAAHSSAPRLRHERLLAIARPYCASGHCVISECG